MSLPEQLTGYQQAYREAGDRVRSLCASMSEEQFNWKPSPERWSVGECLFHLNVISEGYLPVLRGAIRTADRHEGGEFRYGPLSRWFISAVRPDSRAVSTARSMRPPEAEAAGSSIEMESALREFGDYMNQFVELVKESEGLDLAGTKVRSPFLWILRLPVGAFLEALGQHALRHVGQAERVTQEEGFPGGDAAMGPH